MTCNKLFKSSKGTLFTLIILQFILISSCTYHRGNIEKTEIVIIDTISYDLKNIEKDWREWENFEIQYIGTINDSIYTIPFPDINPPPPPGTVYDSINFKNDYYRALGLSKQIEKFIIKTNFEYDKGTIYSDSIDLFVDTNFVIGKYEFSAYPIIIKNSYCDTIRVGYSYQRRIRGMLEAIDSTGNWRPIIEDREIHGLPVNQEIVLPKDGIIISSVYVYSGDYKTQLRFRVGKSYSNSFYSTINYNQFESIFDENGEYKEKYLEYRKRK
ncbi:hypothetical protein [Labilibaculum euxinus]